LIEVITEDSVHLRFLGIDEVALRLKVKVLMPSLIMGGCKFLDVYYVVVKVEDTFVGAVLSQYPCYLGNQEFVPLLDSLLWLKLD
jgi:hypothetical protein